MAEALTDFLLMFAFLRHCQLNGSQLDMTTLYCGHDFFEYPILYYITFS